MFSRVASTDDRRRAKRLPGVGTARDGADMMFFEVGNEELSDPQLY
jgi:hypothetical protein